ncbi:hypothetical protein HMPREF9588_01870 [Cutibacterium acnes HL025PA2]|nr:hypothetical protein HMPREF9588_01870 [Cutibacterium acnes HL025PA2]
MAPRSTRSDQLDDPDVEGLYLPQRIDRGRDLTGWFRGPRHARSSGAE